MTVWIYLRKLSTKWMEMVTGGLIAIFLAVQPYTGVPAPHKWVFWTILVGACNLAAYRVWRDEYRLAEEKQRLLLQAASSEQSRVRFVSLWDDVANASSSRLRLLARNSGRLPLSEFAIHPLRLGLWTVEFETIPILQPDVDQELVVSVHGPMAGPGSNDLLDVLMVNHTDIAPTEYRLEATVIKANGSSRNLQLALSYAPLHNPRRVGAATELERCLTVRQVTAG